MGAHAVVTTECMSCKLKGLPSGFPNQMLHTTRDASERTALHHITHAAIKTNISINTFTLNCVIDAGVVSY